MNARRTLMIGLAWGLGWSGALAPEDVASWADARLAAPLDDDGVRRALDAEYASRFGRPEAAPGTPGASGVPVGRLEESLRQVRAMLATMKPDDPNRANALRIIAALEEQIRLAGGARPTPPASPRPTCPTPPTLPAALNNARAFLKGKVGEANAQKLAKTFTSSDQASKIAAAALVTQRPIVALAALLEAHAKEPKSGQHLVNAAGVASMMGLPCEALAFLDAAENLPPGGSTFDPRAVRLTTRGHALLALGRAQEAEAALRQAVGLDPLLSEARFHLALALHAQNKDEEAARFYRLAGRRTPPKAAPKPRTPTESTGGPQDPEGPSLEIWPPAEEVYDLSRGVGWKLPQLSYPQHPREGAAFARRVADLRKMIDARMRTRSEKLAALAKERGARDANRRTLDAQISRARVDDIVHRIRSIEFDPAVKGGWQLVETELSRDDENVMFNPFRSDAPHTQGKVYYSAVTAAGVFQTAWERIAEQERREREACGPDPQNVCQSRVKLKHDTARCGAFVNAHAAWRPAMTRLDLTYAEVWDPTYKLMTGLAANISDPLDFQFARLTLENRADGLVQDLLSAAISPNGFWNRYQAFLVDTSYKCGELQPAAEIKLEAPASASCDFKGPRKAKIDFEVVEMSFNCEKVAFEFTPLQADFWMWEVGVFQEVEFAFDGKMTLTLGVKSGTNAGAVTQGIKGGFYVTIDDSGLVDLGVKGSTASGVMTGMVGVEVEVESGMSFIPR